MSFRVFLKSFFKDLMTPPDRPRWAQRYTLPAGNNDLRMNSPIPDSEDNHHVWRTSFPLTKVPMSMAIFTGDRQTDWRSKILNRGTR